MNFIFIIQISTWLIKYKCRPKQSVSWQLVLTETSICHVVSRESLIPIKNSMWTKISKVHHKMVNFTMKPGFELFFSISRIVHGGTIWKDSQDFFQEQFKSVSTCYRLLPLILTQSFDHNMYSQSELSNCWSIRSWWHTHLENWTKTWYRWYLRQVTTLFFYVNSDVYQHRFIVNLTQFPV